MAGHTGQKYTDLWKHQVMRENFSVIRPQIVENFVQRLLENYQDGGLEITFRKDHLEACLLSLGCDVMARERSNFESYSMCYEHVLEHARQKLCQKEQELDIIRRGHSPPEDKAGQIAELSHNMIMEVTALRTRLMDLEEETLDLKKQIRKEVQEEYEALVQALFVTCLHIKAQLLKELDHRVTQEALHRQQLDLMKIASMEKLLEDVEQQEQHLQLLTEEAKRASKLGQLQQKKIQGELRQVYQVLPPTIISKALFSTDEYIP
ncbi:coiled-coil domain-containing protein 162-like isoform X5 [Physeter macrocephalus]|uniref:Coiled-coil domain-containing protein 162-like isoform X5 n=1 Tax=Physeter macrocephalus TaxID=9755 RepID=A0A9W2WWZ0_PHYMC|nr:coiled-coil domain-containing protein 162-like isoform X5 [Physeter catodon]